MKLTKKVKKTKVKDTKLKSLDNSKKKSFNNYMKLTNKIKDNKLNLINIYDEFIVFAYIYFIVYIIFLSCIIYYINSIKNCACFIELNKTENVNINYIYIIEILFLVISVITFITFIGMNYILKNKIKSKLSGGAKGFLYTNLFLYILILVIDVYLIYNIYKLFKIPDDNCNCMKNWLKNLLYIQVILIIIGIIIMLFDAYKLFLLQ